MKQISKEQKSNLARLLATENLNIEHKKVKTAYFVPKTRTLCLPIWEDMSNDLYDLLCGHEVGHALYTPQDEKLLKEKMKDIPHSYFNVIEDIRIDKNMKAKYPGLRKSYFNGYKELVERDFFGDIKEDANKMRFIDRLNIFTKSGNLENTIEFNDIEKEFIDESANLKTFDDVIKLAKKIFAYSKEENYNEEEDPLSMQNQNGNLNEEEDDQSEQTDSSTGDGDEEGNEQTEGGDGEEEKEQKSDNEADTTSSKDDKPETNEGSKTEEKAASGPEGGHNPDLKAGVVEGNKNEAKTDIAFEENKGALSQTDEKTRDNYYVSLPKMKKEAIVDYKVVLKKFNNYISSKYTKDSYSYKQEDIIGRNRRFKEFKRTQMKTVHYMVKEFEMKKAADNYSKTLTSVSGSLNMNKLHSYKYNDDIFKKLQIEPGAKNHGMIMFVDWSGSMSDNMEDTVNQTLNLVMFCKAVQIPFEVFAFSDINRVHFYDNKDETDLWMAGKRSVDLSPFHHNPGDLFVENVTLINFLSSRMKTREYNEGMQMLFGVGEHMSNRYYYNRRFSTVPEEEQIQTVSMPQCLRLGGTPLDPCIIAATTIVKEFISKNKIQKMNTIFLTDGCGHSLGNIIGDQTDTYGDSVYRSNLVIKDDETKIAQPYNSDGWGFNSCHKPMLDRFKRKTGSKAIGFYITSRNTVSWSDINTFMPKNSGYDGVEAVRKQMRKDKVGTIVGNGYDELFIIPKKNLKIVDEEADIKPDMTPSKMKQQFLKTLRTKKTSRVLLNKFVERVA